MGDRRRHPAHGLRAPVTRPWLLVATLFAVSAYGCEPGVPELEMEVLRTLAHDTAAYTQGLLLADDVFFESTGQYGESELRRVDVETGAVLSAVQLPDEYFGEGLALAGDRLVQLTWKEGRALLYDVETLEDAGSFEYEGEGWGLCFDGTHFFMSDGSSQLERRDAETFDVLEEISVTRDGFSVSGLNELECVGDHIWANVYMSNDIVQIDRTTGDVVGELDAYALTLASERSSDVGAVLNGIAFDASSGTFYLTGKLWSSMFEVRIVN